MKKPSLITKLLIVIPAVLILLAIVIVIITSSGNPSDVLKEAVPLVEANFDAVSYYKIAQLPPKTEAEFSYENYPEGTVPCDNSVFSSYSELESFIRNTYTPMAAEMILSSDVNGSPRYFDHNGELCKTPAPTDTSYNKDFSSYTVGVRNVTSKSAEAVVTVSLKNGGSEELVLKMVKENDKWLLEGMVY